MRSTHETAALLAGWAESCCWLLPGVLNVGQSPLLARASWCSAATHAAHSLTVSEALWAAALAASADLPRVTNQAAASTVLGVSADVLHYHVGVGGVWVPQSC